MSSIPLWFRVALLGPLLLLVPACGGSSSSDADLGEITLSLTDAASDEVAVFEVDVSDIVFTKADSSTVSVLPRRTRVDFAQLESVAELIVGIGLEAGRYVSASLTLDFTEASVYLEGETTPATILDKDGNTINGPLAVQVSFALGSEPIVLPRRHHLFVLDLDLDQGLTVNAGSNEVTFCPVISAALDPSNPKPLVATGLLDSVNPISSTFILEKRNLDGDVLGSFEVQVLNTTVFQIDGVVALGGAGLLALGAQPVGARVFLQGTVNPTDRTITALGVESGGGTPGNGQDWVIGHVVARDNGAGSNAALTVLGHSVDVSNGTRTFNTLHTVNVTFGPTRVLRRGAGNTLDSDAVNVGQLVWSFGVLTGTTLDATNATDVVRLLPTSVFGIAAGPPVANTLTLDVQRIGLRTIGNFDFNVGGMTEADPASYAVDVSGLGTGGIVTDDKIRVIGWAEAVGSAGVDFSGISTVNRSTDAKLLIFQWLPATPGVLTGFSPTAVTVDVSSAFLAVVGDGFDAVIVNSTPTPKIEPLAPIGFYRIVQNGFVEFHLSFDSFRTSLESRAQGNSVFRVAALGTYDEVTQTFDALVVSVVLD